MRPNTKRYHINLKQNLTTTTSDNKTLLRRMMGPKLQAAERAASTVFRTVVAHFQITIINVASHLKYIGTGTSSSNIYCSDGTNFQIKSNLFVAKMWRRRGNGDVGGSRLYKDRPYVAVILK